MIESDSSWVFFLLWSASGDLFFFLSQSRTHPELSELQETSLVILFPHTEETDKMDQLFIVIFPLLIIFHLIRSVNSTSKCSVAVCEQSWPLLRIHPTPGSGKGIWVSSTTNKNAELWEKAIVFCATEKKWLRIQKDRPNPIFFGLPIFFSFCFSTTILNNVSDTKLYNSTHINKQIKISVGQNSNQLLQTELKIFVVVPWVLTQHCKATIP